MQLDSKKPHFSTTYLTIKATFADRIPASTIEHLSYSELNESRTLHSYGIT